MMYNTILENNYYNMSKTANRDIRVGNRNIHPAAGAMAVGGVVGGLGVGANVAANWNRYMQQGINTSMANSAIKANMQKYPMSKVLGSGPTSQTHAVMRDMNPRLFKGPKNLRNVSTSIRSRPTMFGNWYKHPKGFFSLGDDAVYASSRLSGMRPSAWNHIAGRARGFGKGLAHVGLGVGAGAALLGGGYLLSQYLKNRNR